MFGLFKDAGASNRGWENPLFLSLLAALFFTQISISAVQVFLAVAFLSWIVLLVQKRRSFSAPSFFWPLAAYAILSLVSSAASVNPGLSIKDSRKLLLYVLVPVVFTAFRKKREVALAYGALLLSGLINGLYSTAYFLFVSYPGQRVKGFMGHYMTQAGVLALFGALALSMIFFSRGKGRPVWGAGLALAGAALAFTLTRSAWVGLGLALCVVLFLWKPKALAFVPVLAAVAFVTSPAPIRSRVLSIFTLRDSSNSARLEYLGAGLKIVRDFPILGTGPDTVDVVFQNPKYGLSELSRKNVHLHNNIVQIAAERGIVGLAAWLAFMLMAFLAAIRLFRKKSPGILAPAAGALAALAALAAAGFFEYNFGDSEVTTILFLLITLPFALDRLPESEPSPISAVSKG